MPRYRVLLTDYAWADVSVERCELAKIDAELVVADRQDVDSLAELAGNVDAIMTCWAQVPREVIAAAGRCRIVSRMGIGLDNIDVPFCTSRGIPVTNVPDYCSAEVSEHTVALILALARHIAVFHHQTKLAETTNRNPVELLRHEARWTLDACPCRNGAAPVPDYKNLFVFRISPLHIRHSRPLPSLQPLRPFPAPSLPPTGGPF